MGMPSYKLEAFLGSGFYRCKFRGLTSDGCAVCLGHHRGSPHFALLQRFCALVFS
jgi:hypothetical protein